MTLSLPVPDLKGNVFRRTIYSPSLTVIDLMLTKLWRGYGGGGGGWDSKEAPLGLKGKANYKQGIAQRKCCRSTQDL